MIRFVHAGDVHLGFVQYGSQERQKDFARAFRRLTEQTIARKADLLLLAGDTLHGRAMNPRTLLQAIDALAPLQEQGVKVLAIPGNHDRSWRSESLNWLHALQELGYLQLLDVSIEGGELELGPQSIYETDDIRVIGIPYVGMGLPHIIPQLAEHLATFPRKYTVLLLHAGLEGEMPGFRASLSMEALEPLRPYVDYVALSHLHKPFQRDGWIYNPGSLETVSIDEAQWQDRGYLVVDVEGLKAQVERVPTERRAFVQMSWPVDDYDSFDLFFEELDLCLTDENEHSPGFAQDPVLELRLEGRLRFDRASLEIPRIEELLQDLFHPVVCRIRDMTESDASEMTVGENLSRVELERQVVRGLVERDSQREPHADAWTAWVLEARDLALRRTAPEKVIEAGRAFRQQIQKEKP